MASKYIICWVRTGNYVSSSDRNGGMRLGATRKEAKRFNKKRAEYLAAKFPYDMQVERVRA